MKRGAPIPTLTVDDLLITSELWTRPKRSRHGRKTGAALRALSQEIGEHPEDPLPRFVELARQLCGGGSAGISDYEPQPDGAGIFRWAGLTGRAASFNGQTTPRDFSPCGICLDRGEIILMRHPGEYYGWLNLPGVPLTEALLVPLLIRGKAPFGTLWIMSHDDHRFDSDDAQALREISSVACLAIGLLSDVAEQKALVTLAKQQSTKMEALGQLTGGIAHDFNNLLTILTGQLDIIRDRIDDEKLKNMVDRGLKAAAQGGKLVQHLMAFARRQPLRLELIEPGPVLSDIVDTLTRSLSTLDVDSHIAADLWPIFVDQSQLESALLNLAINARDAMHARGHLTVDARNVHLRNGPGDDRLTGDYVVIVVTDTGPGMSPEILEKAFEPFFTTKGVGIGTGLGLSMVHDFATQSGGAVQIQSEIGNGTTVTIYLPRAKIAA